MAGDEVESAIKFIETRTNLRFLYSDRPDRVRYYRFEGFGRGMTAAEVKFAARILGFVR